MISKLPSDIPNEQAINTLETLGFKIVRQKGDISSIFEEQSEYKITFYIKFKKYQENQYISLMRVSSDSSIILLTMPKQPNIKSSTLGVICYQSGISRKDLLMAYEKIQQLKS